MFYRQHIFPLLTDHFLSIESIMMLRRQLLAEVQSPVLEIGMAKGLNLLCYPPHIQRVTAVDNNPSMVSWAQQRGRTAGVTVDYKLLDARQLAFPSASFHSVVSTWTLCSIREARQTLGEIARVLVPGGRFFFLEHGLAPGWSVRLMQYLMEPLHRLLVDGCSVTIDMPALITAGGFEIETVNSRYVSDMAAYNGYVYMGIARKASS